MGGAPHSTLNAVVPPVANWPFDGLSHSVFNVGGNHENRSPDSGLHSSSGDGTRGGRHRERRQPAYDAQHPGVDPQLAFSCCLVAATPAPAQHLLQGKRPWLRAYTVVDGP